MKFPQSVMIWAAMSSAGVGPLCFLKSTVNPAIYQEIFEHFMLPSADKLYVDADLIFQQDLAPAHTAKGTKSWFNENSKTLYEHNIRKLQLSAGQVLMDDYCNQGKDDYSDIQVCALGACYVRCK